MANTHHCPMCKNGVFKNSCIKKGHMWFCSKHQHWTRRDWPWVSCCNKAQSRPSTKRREDGEEDAAGRKKSRGKVKRDDVKRGSRTVRASRGSKGRGLK
jgi:hypothetical protein